jgi:DNA-binding transcriptional regulator YdaS (Cro superfamily)
MLNMNTQTAIQLAGSKAKLAIILGVSRPAVTQYRERLPKKRIAVLMEKCPQWFEEKPPEVEIKEAVLTPV